MKFPSLVISTIVVSMAIVSFSAHAQDATSKKDAMMQDFNDSQFCAALLKKLGGDENTKKSASALAHAKEIAPAVGFGSKEAFNQSYDDLSEILGMANEHEMKEFTKFCTKKW